MNKRLILLVPICLAVCVAALMFFLGKTQTVQQEDITFDIPATWVTEHHESGSKYYPESDLFSKALVYVKVEDKGDLLHAETPQDQMKVNIQNIKESPFLLLKVKEKTIQINETQGTKLSFLQKNEGADIGYDLEEINEFGDPPEGKTFITSLFFIYQEKLYTLECYNDNPDTNVFDEIISSIQFKKSASTSTAQPRAKGRKELELLDSGYWTHYDNELEGLYLDSAVKIRNPNPDKVADNIQMEIIGKDSKGQVLFHEKEDIAEKILPNTTIGIEGPLLLDLSKEPTTVDIRIYSNDWRDFEYADELLKAPLEVTNQSYKVIKNGSTKEDPLGNGRAELSGEIINPNPFSYDTDLYVLFKDKTGKIIGSNYFLISEIKRKGKTHFAVKVEYHSGVSEYEVFAMPMPHGLGEV